MVLSIMMKKWILPKKKIHTHTHPFEGKNAKTIPHMRPKWPKSIPSILTKTAKKTIIP